MTNPKMIDIIAGARPNFVKIASIIRSIVHKQNTGLNLKYRLVHTGQHSDSNMSDVFFQQLQIPDPDVCFGVESGTDTWRTANIMIKYEELLIKKPADLCLVVGDVSSTLACSITAQKLKIPVAHVEAGIRSGDWSMPEEINRMATDAVTNYFFTTSKTATEYLRSSGVSNDRIFFVGNTMIDTLLHFAPKFKKPGLWDIENLERGKYIVATLHRPANVDVTDKLEKTLFSLGKAAGNLKVIFPVHPRTANIFSQIKEVPQNIVAVEAQPYLEFNYLVKNALAVVTDSGGVTEETTIMGIPCMTLRNCTERPETISTGTNVLLGPNSVSIESAFAKLRANQWKSGAVPEKWDGKSAERIISALGKILCSE